MAIDLTAATHAVADITERLADNHEIHLFGPVDRLPGKPEFDAILHWLEKVGHFAGI
jgi:hypothetical protein